MYKHLIRNCKIILGCSLLLLVAVFSGCGSEVETEADAEALYTEQRIVELSKTEGDLQNIQCMLLGEEVYFSANHIRNKEVQIGYVGEQIEIIATLPGESVLGSCAVEKQEVAILTHRVEDGQYLLHCYKEGEEEATFVLEEAMREMDSVVPFSAMALYDNKLVLVTWNQSEIWIIDYTTDAFSKITLGVSVTNLAVEEDGHILAITANGMLYRINLQDGNRQEIASGLYTHTGNNSSCLLAGEEILITGQKGLYQYLPESGKTELIADYVKCNIMPTEYTIAVEVTESGKIYKMIAVNEEEESLEICLLSTTEIPADYMATWNGHTAVNGADEIAEEEKQVIIIDVPWSITLEETIIAFNQSSDKYRVECCEEEYDFLRRNTELITGGGPDIFTAASTTYYNDYVEKGLLVDLKPYMEADLDESAYLQHLLYAYEQDGKVYAIEPEISVCLLAGSKDILGERNGWTFEELKEVMEANPQITTYRNIEPMDVLRDCWLLGGIPLGDYETLRECILFAEKYGNPLDAGMEEVPGENVLVVRLQMNTPLSLAGWEWQYGNNLCLIGYPQVDRQGMTTGNMGLSINANSENIEGAWEFMKFLLSEEYQSQLEYSFPILKSAYEEMLYKYGKPDTYEVYIPELGETVQITNGYSLPQGGIIDFMTEEQLDIVDELVGACTVNKHSGGYQGWQIICEEVEPYFAGDKTLDEVMEIIENRTELYLKEK